MSDLNPHVEFIELNKNKYPMAYNLNVIDELQHRFNMSITEFVNKVLNDKIFSFEGTKAMLYEMINEGIEILNDEGGEYSFITEDEIGELLIIHGVEPVTCTIIEYSLDTLPKEDEKQEDCDITVMLDVAYIQMACMMRFGMSIKEARRETLRQFSLLTKAYCKLEGKIDNEENKSENNQTIQTFNF